MTTLARPRFLLAICRNMLWVEAGLFASEREAAIVAAEGTGDAKIIKLRAGDDPQTVLASLKRSLVITRLQGPDQRVLLIRFSFKLHPNPIVSTYRQPVFSRTTDAGMAVKFQTVPEARACLEDVRRFAPEAVIRVMDWREPRP